MKGASNETSTADFTNHLEEYEKVLVANEFNVYECTNCDCPFAVSQRFEDHSEIVCPSCLDDSHVIDVGAGTMMKRD
ncbi:hypothetical protein ACU5CE_32990 [Priestia megaterium]|uniref:hypothetical protein n=1 Tax=Priestia megaterium TaxID=1404 RepID=UPI00406BA88E